MEGILVIRLLIINFIKQESYKFRWNWNVYRCDKICSVGSVRIKKKIITRIRILVGQYVMFVLLNSDHI